MEFVDIHGHYAWGIDDGIRDLEEAKAALKNASNIGVKVIAATPHVISGTHFEKEIQHFRERISELKREANKLGIEVHEGSELFLNHDAPTSIRSGYFIPYENTKYALCEFDVRRNLVISFHMKIPNMHYVNSMSEEIFQMTKMKLKNIFTH